MKYEITNTNDLNNVYFDTAVSVPVFVGDDKVHTDKYIGVFNQNKNSLAQIASNKYSIIQHNEVLKAVTEVLNEHNLNVSGRVDDFGNKIRADLVFMNDTPIKDDATGVKIGMRVLNSYDRTTSFRLEMYGFRLVCQNGMSFGSVMNNVKEVAFHMGKEYTLQRIKLITSQFIRNAIASSDALQNVINNSIADSVSYQDAMKTLEKCLKQKNHREKICEKLGIDVIEVYDKEKKKRTFTYMPKDDRTTMSRWDLYNAITDYATHTEFSYNLEKNLQNSAQEILKKSFEKLLEVESN